MAISALNIDSYRDSTEFSVCFSGGIDSTFVACYFGLQYKKDIHLVTVDHGYGNLFPGLRYRHICDIKRLLGKERVCEAFINTKVTFKEILINSVKEDYRRYKSNFIWCLGCVLSLHTHMVIYNLIHSIPRCFFCSSLGGEKFAVMSIPVTINAMQEFYASYGIVFSTPLLDLKITKKEEKRQLRRWDIWPGWVVGKGTLGVQPICIPGFLQHWRDVFFDIHPIYANDKVSDFIKKKIPIMKKIIRRHLNLEIGSTDTAKRGLNKAYL